MVGGCLGGVCRLGDFVGIGDRGKFLVCDGGKVWVVKLPCCVACKVWGVRFIYSVGCRVGMVGLRGKIWNRV